MIGIAAIVLGVATFKIQQRQTRTQQEQAETNALQLRLALFEKRMKVFDSTMDLLAAVGREAKVELNQLFALLQNTREHEFLFGPDVGSLIDEIYKRGLELRTRQRVRTDEDDSIAKETELLIWFVGQMTEARRIFLPYIDFRKP